MRRLSLITLGCIAFVLLSCAATLNSITADHHQSHDRDMGDVHHAVAVIEPTEGNDVRGVAIFHQHDGSVTVTIELEGLSANGTHAWHIHEYGDMRSDDGTAMGGHYNPEGHDHALPEKDMRHAGDLGNLTADAQGRARAQITVNNISVAGRYNPIAGRGVIVHADPDDGGQPTGNAGARIGQGVIGITAADG